MSSLRPFEHPEWCAKGHRCALGEHRATPVVTEVPGVGKVLITRVLTSNGRERMELTGSAYLAPRPADARRQVQRTLHGVASAMQHAAVTAGVR